MNSRMTPRGKGNRTAITCLRTVLSSCLLAGTALAANATTIASAPNLDDTKQLLRVDGVVIASIARFERGWTLESDSVRAVLVETEIPLSPDHSYPRRIKREGRLEPSIDRVWQEYTLLAPAAPLRIEGLDAKGSPDTEVEQWLAQVEPETSAADLRKIHEHATGRPLAVWYEISGRRVDGLVTSSTAPESPTAFDSLLHAVGSELKAHHARPLDNGHVLFDPQSVELVDVISNDQGKFRSYECGCYGWGNASDWATVDSTHLFHVEVEYVNHANGSWWPFEARWEFPWIGWADRHGARRVGSYNFLDAGKRPVARLEIGWATEPHTQGLGDLNYDFQVAGSDGTTTSIATAAFTDGVLAIHLHPRDSGAPGTEDGWVETLTYLDRLLAAMPTQVLRGDGIRDSRLSEIEMLIDWVRLVRDPQIGTLGDVVSEIDALTSLGKVRALLGDGAERFVPSDRVPDPPRRCAQPPCAAIEQVWTNTD